MMHATVRLPIGKVEGRITRRREDLLAVEEPLEIRVGAQSVSVTMRTPGHDFELAAGFLFAEDIIRSASQIREITSTAPNIVNVELSSEVVIQPANSQRGFIMTSACGVCGKKSLESLAANRCAVVPSSNLTIDAGVIHRLPQQLRDRQEISESTGGLQAAAFFDRHGELEVLREDVGRHNAVDKLVGNALLRFRTPRCDSVMLVSGRASFELAQKASMAGVPLPAAVGGPIQSGSLDSRALRDDTDRISP
jgi:FdhD protein